MHNSLVMRKVIVIHYSEIGLKKGNRNYFEKRLCQNVDKTLTGCGVGKTRRISGRLLLTLNTDSDTQEITNRLKKVFGIAYFAEAWRTEWEIEFLCDSLWEIIKPLSFKSFRIDTRRSDKRFPMNSMEVNETVGRFIQDRSKASVNLTNPDLWCHIELVEGEGLLYFKKISGPGGLPAHTGGKIMVLLSGGIDSPVAAWKMIRRGCSATFVHFHSFPYTNKESQEKAKQLASLLSHNQLSSRIYLVSFADIQKKIMIETPMAFRVILYRRYMLRLAEQIAFKEKARALVTGDSLGQVASQTLENIDVISRAVKTPILRPLVGTDKEEIISLGRMIGTYDISVLPDQDCCSLFVPKHPETRANLQRIEKVEENLNVKEEFRRALDSSQLLIQYPAYETRPVRQL